MPAGSRPRKRTAAAAADPATFTADEARIAPPSCSSTLPAPAVSHPASPLGSQSGSVSDLGSAAQSSTGQQPQSLAAINKDQPDDVEPPKRKRGRPRKLVYYVSNTNILNETHADDEDREYEKLRKINHNVIERRRRDQINQSISELAEMLPMSIHQGAALNKLNTLKLSVEFVRQLTAQNQELLVELQVMRTMLQERGVDWKLVEVAIAERRAQMTAEAQQQVQQDHQQAGLPRLLPSTSGGQVAIAANKAQAQHLQQQQPSSEVAQGPSAVQHQQWQEQQSDNPRAVADRFQATASPLVVNEGRWLPPTHHVASLSSTQQGVPTIVGRVASVPDGNTPPSTPRASPVPSITGGGLVALASVACAMDAASAPPSPAGSTSSLSVAGNLSLRLPPAVSSSLSLPVQSSAPMGAPVPQFPNHSPFHPINAANNQQSVYTTPTSVPSATYSQPAQLAPVASSYPTSSVYSVQTTTFSSDTAQAVQYQQQQPQSAQYPPAPAAYGPPGSQIQQQQQFMQPASQTFQQQQQQQPQYFYYSAPHSRQVTNGHSVPASPLVAGATWTTGPGFLN